MEGFRNSPTQGPGHAAERESPAFEVHRKRLTRFEIPRQGRYLTCSCRHRLPLLSNDRIKQALVERIELARGTHLFKLVAWVIMPEHVHLLIVPQLPEYPVPEVLRAIKRPLAELVIRRWRELDAPILGRLMDVQGRYHFWQAGGGYDRNIFSGRELSEKINYIHMNPVKRGIVPFAADYPWSSAREYAGRTDVVMRVDRD